MAVTHDLLCGGLPGRGCFTSASAQPGYAFHKGDEPRAQAEDYGKENQDIVVSAVNAPTETKMHELIEIKHGVVADKIDHGVHADVADYRYAGEGDRQQQTGESAEGEHGLHDKHEDVAGELVAAHGIGAGGKGVANHEPKAQEYGTVQDVPLLVAVCDAAPELSQIETEGSHEHVVQSQPDGVALPEQRIADEGEGHSAPRQKTHFVEEVDCDIGAEEAEKEPDGLVAIEGGCFPQVVP